MTAIAVGSPPAAVIADARAGGSSDRPALTLSWAELAEYARDAARSGGCTRPVRLKGRLDAVDLASGERRTVYDTAAEPGGVLLMPCGNRREIVCPPCSQVYKQDARQLVRAGQRVPRGAGVPPKCPRRSMILPERRPAAGAAGEPACRPGSVHPR